MACSNRGSVNAYDTFDGSEVDVSIKLVEKWKRPSCQFLVFFLLMATLIGLVVFISLTYALNLQCQGKDDSQKAKSDNLVSFLLFSDIHLDRFYNDAAASSTFCWNGSVSSNYIAKYGRVKCDSPRRLFQSALTAMKNRSSEHKFGFILLTGDTCAHNMGKLFSNSTIRRYNTLKTIKESSDEVKSAFPSIPYFPSVGNNDLPAHYVLPGPNDSWYGDLLDIWQDSILCTKCNNSHKTTTKEELRRTFLKGGYYNASVAGGTMTLLVLNSMYWTKGLWKCDAYFRETAATQMNWLENQLYLARKLNKKVLITSHIPPGIDPYPNKTGAYNALWLGNFTKLYADLVVHKYSDVIAGQLYAHFHKDSFRFLHNESSDPTFKNSSFILLVPSISPIYKNNPSFRVVHLDPDQRAMIDYEQYYMNLVMATEFDNPVWQLDYKFSAKYPSKGLEDKVINAMRMKSVSDNFINQTSDDVFTGFINSRQVRYQPDPFSRFVYYCVVRYFSQEDFNECQKNHVVLGG